MPNRRVLITLAILVAIAAAGTWWTLRPRTLMSTLEGLSMEETLRRTHAMTPEQREQLHHEYDADHQARLAKAPNRWEGRISVSEMDNVAEASYQNSAMTTVATVTTTGIGEERPEMRLTCERGETRVVVDTKLSRELDTAKRPVRIRFDEAAPIQIDMWFAKNRLGDLNLVADQPLVMLQQLLGAKTMLLEVDHPSGARQLLSFDVHGLSDHILKDVESENSDRRRTAESDKKPAPPILMAPCGWGDVPAQAQK